MRSITSRKPEFHFNTYKEQADVQAYHLKYNRIGVILDENSQVLSLVHDELSRKLNASKGRDSEYSSESLFRMLLVKCIEQLSFRDLVVRVSDSMFLRNFVRIGMGPIMGIGLLDATWKCISDPTWDRVNALLTSYAIENKKITGDSLRIDSTVCETNIHFPTDSSLLWDVYRVTARQLQSIQNQLSKYGISHRFHLRKIKKLHTFISTQSGRKNKATKRRVKSTFRQLIKRVEDIVRNGFGAVEILNQENDLDRAHELHLLLISAEQVVHQARRSQLHGEVVPAKERIFSIFEPHTELLKRGKTQKPNEFGHLVTIAQTKEKFISHYAVDDCSEHDTYYRDIALESHKERFGTYPTKFAADKNYHISCEDTAEWETKIDVFAVGKKGKRSEEEEEREHTDAFREMQRFRAGSEGTISVLKRAFGLSRSLYRTFKSFASSICRLVFCHNLVLLATQ